jgi:hypothetical protein
MLENRRGNWKSICDISETKGARLDNRFGRAGPSSMVREVMPLDRISVTEGPICDNGSKDDSVSVVTAGLRLDGLESSIGESGRVTFRAVAGDLLFPFRIESCDLPGVVLMIHGIGGASVVGLFIVE